MHLREKRQYVIVGDQKNAGNLSDDINEMVPTDEALKNNTSTCQEVL